MFSEEFIQVSTTFNKKEEAEAASKFLVKKRIAACVQIIGPISSTYYWKGNLETTTEWLCLIKSKKEFFNIIEKYIEKLNSYETPELIATPIIAGSKEYLAWIKKEINFEKKRKIKQ